MRSCMKHHQIRPTRNVASIRQLPTAMRGTTRIEVLIAVLVLGIGMLGIASLQATSLRNSQSSLERSQAVIATYAIIDAMRANRNDALAGARSEEHTSELQSLMRISYAVFCLKKKKTT